VAESWLLRDPIGKVCHQLLRRRREYEIQDTLDVRLSLAGWVAHCNFAMRCPRALLLGPHDPARAECFGGGGHQSQAGAAAARRPIRRTDKEGAGELRRLDCLNGRIDGKLGDQTREAVRKFWASAKQPVVEVDITDELIANLAGRGDNFCRPPRRFFGFGGRALPPLFAPGARPGSIPPTTAHPVSPDPAH
jgi:hypothetical protein